MLCWQTRPKSWRWTEDVAIADGIYLLGGDIAAIVLGVIMLVILIIVVVLLICRCLRRKKTVPVANFRKKRDQQWLEGVSPTSQRRAHSAARASVELTTPEEEVQM